MASHPSILISLISSSGHSGCRFPVWLVGLNVFIELALPLISWLSLRKGHNSLPSVDILLSYNIIYTNGQNPLMVQCIP